MGIIAYLLTTVPGRLKAGQLAISKLPNRTPPVFTLIQAYFYFCLLKVLRVLLFLGLIFAFVAWQQSDAGACNIGTQQSSCYWLYPRVAAGMTIFAILLGITTTIFLLIVHAFEKLQCIRQTSCWLSFEFAYCVIMAILLLITGAVMARPAYYGPKDVIGYVLAGVLITSVVAYVTDGIEKFCACRSGRKQRDYAAPTAMQDAAGYQSS